MNRSTCPPIMRQSSSEIDHTETYKQQILKVAPTFLSGDYNKFMNHYSFLLIFRHQMGEKLEEMSRRCWEMAFNWPKFLEDLRLKEHQRNRRKDAPSLFEVPEAFTCVQEYSWALENRLHDAVVLKGQRLYHWESISIVIFLVIHIDVESRLQT